MINTRLIHIILITLSICSVGCGKKSSDDRIEVTFWHTQGSSRQPILNEIIDGFNASQEKYRVVPQYVGGYDQIYRKTAVNIRAHKPPALVTAYESMVAEYYEAGAVVDLEQYLNDPEVGLSPESQADFYPLFLKANHYKHYDNKMLSFPFTKSLLMMYYNQGLLEELGFDGPPHTWQEFRLMCQAATEAGRGGYTVSVDASTIDAMVYTFCGDVVNERETQTLFTQKPTRRVFELLDTMAREGLVQLKADSAGDQTQLAQGQIAFAFRSSTARPYFKRDVEALEKAGKPHAKWNLAILPHAEGCDPVTVMYGANICMLKTSPEVQRGAWEFIKYFTSAEATAKWSVNTGYLPVRRSALQTEAMQNYIEDDPRACKPLDALDHATTEPTVRGWQEVRMYIEDAERNVLTGNETVDQALERLQARSNNLLYEVRTGAGAEAPPAFTIGFLGAILISGVVAWRIHKPKNRK